MAKLEIPSIVVHSGSPSVPGVNMERPARQTPQLRKQKSSMDDGDTGCLHHSKSEPMCSSSSNNNNNQESTPKISDTSPGGAGGGGKPSSPGGPNSKTDEGDKPASGPQPQLSRSRSNGKMKMLTRSHAMREATSPPPDPSAATTSTSAAQTTPSTVVNHSNGKSNSQASKHSNNNNNGSSNHHTGSNNNNSGSGNSSNFNNNNNSKSKSGNNNNNNNNKNSKEQSNYSSNRNNHRQNRTPIYISSPQEAWSGLLNRDNSTDSQFQDASKADLDAFIAQQMSTKNRSLLLKVEDELIRLVEDARHVYFKFPQMTSFHRMLVHRAATYFNMDHNLDASGACVIVNRNRNSKRPERSFLQIMKDVKGLNSRAYSSEEPRKSILKRDFASFEDSQYKSDEKQLSLESRRSKSFEEREEEYERARRRIFSRDDSTDSCLQNSDSNQDSMEDVRWSECVTWSGDEPEPTGRYLRPNDRSPRLMKTESYESRDFIRGNSTRSAVSKSYSFGGYTGNSASSSNNNNRTGPNHGQSFTGLHRGDSNASSLSTGSRVLAKQDSGSSASSRLSPSSSGYKSQSQQSDATLSATPSPTATPNSLLPMSSLGSQDTLSPEPPVIWPISSSGGNIPSGSVLINPATGQPICNADGTVYRFDPENPLKLHVPRAQSPPPPNYLVRQNEKITGKGELPEEDNPWAKQQSPKGGSPASSGKSTTEANVSKLQQPQPQTKGQGSTKQAEKQDHGEQPKGQGSQAQGQDKRSQYRHDGQGPGQAKGGSDPAADGSLHVVNPRSVTNTATSPMLLASPQRAMPMSMPPPPPAQAGQPIVVGGGGPAGPPPAGGGQGYSMVGSPMVSVVPYYPNGAYGFAPDVAGPGQYYPSASGPGHGPSPFHMAQHGYAGVGMVGVDPAFMPPPTQQPPPPPGQPGAPCCLPGYPCPYANAGPAPGPGPPPPAGTYDQRTPEAGQVVADMTNYMMNMNLNGSGVAGVDQRAGGDAGLAALSAMSGQGPVRADGSSPQQGPQGQGPGPGPGTYYWGCLGGPQLSSHNQGYPPTVMYYYPPNNMASPQSSGTSSSGPSSTPVPASNSNSTYNRGNSPPSNSREHSNSRASTNSSGSTATSTTGGSNRSYNRNNVAASYAKGAAIYQPPVYSMPNVQVAPPSHDRTMVNGYPNDCVAVAAPQQQVVYTVSSMHSNTVPTQSYQPAVYSSTNATVTASGTGPPSTITYYQGVQGSGDTANPSLGQGQGQALMPLSPYVTPQGYMPCPAPGTPPLTPQGSYAVHPYMYSMGPGAPSSPAAYQNIGPHQSPMIQRMMRPSLILGGMQHSPPPRNMGPKGFPRGQSPVGRKDQTGSGDNIRYTPPYSVPMYNLAASRYMSGDMRYMPGRLPFSIPTNTYQRPLRPFQTSYYPRPHSQPSGEALNLTRPPRVRKPTNPHSRSPARGPFVGREFKAFPKSSVMKKS